jgi:endonuclease-3
MTAAPRLPGPGGPRASTAPPDVPAIVTRLARTFPNATTELDFTNAFELLVATVLSAQSTDARVNTVTPALFARYPDPASLAKASPAELEPQIVPTGFFRQKSQALIGLAQALVSKHHGEVPADMEALTALPGVGRKTANVVLGHALGVPGLPVDRHVLRVATRIGVASAATPERVEAQLCARLPPEMWTLASDCLILHGRRVCRPRPLCQKCTVNDVCLFYRRGGVGEAPGTARGPRAAKGTGATTGRQATSPGAATRPARTGVGEAGPVSRTVAAGRPRRTPAKPASKKGSR